MQIYIDAENKGENGVILFKAAPKAGDQNFLFFRGIQRVVSYKPL